MFGSIVQTFTNCFKIPELKSRIFFTVLLLAICRFIAFVRIPGLDASALQAYFKSNAGGDGGMLGMYSLFTGGALENCAVGALGIMPYISATIIIQLLTAVIPKLSKLAREEGVTRTASVSIYDDVQALDYASAGRTSAVLLVMSCVALSMTYALRRRAWSV